MWQHFGGINNNLNQTIMTVKELKSILCSIENEELPVVVNGYYVQEINGYFYDKKDDVDVLMLTPHNVQPRIV